jgi:serine/threonine protein phosphatase PrpC
MFYVANLGNSRGILSKDLGHSIYQISVDHTPSNEKEKDRIIKMGGSAVLSDDNPQRPGVYITKPGKLEVSRSFGYANLKEGNPGLVLSIPDIISFELKEDFDFIILGSKIYI